MNRAIRHSFFITALAMACAPHFGCTPSTGTTDNTSTANDNTSVNDNVEPSNDNVDGDNSNDNTPSNNDGLPFASVTGNETFIEGSDFTQGAAYSRRAESFTSSFTVTPSDVDSQQILVNGVLTEEFFGNLIGSARLSYDQSDEDYDPELECPLSTLAGSVTWSVNLTGNYSAIPAVGTLRITAYANPVDSPEYPLSYTVPGCREQDFEQPTSYAWPGPAQGNPAAVLILLENGHFEMRIENPFADDLGEEDFYEIVVDSTP